MKRLRLKTAFPLSIARSFFPILFPILLTPLYASAKDFPIAYPGYSWGKLIHDNDKVGGNGGQWNIVQGVDWYKFSGDIVLNTYGAFNHRSRENNTRYYNSEGPAVGVELVKGPVSLGYEYYKERLPKLQETSHNRAYYFKGYLDWEHIMLSNETKFPGSLWFQTTHDVSGINGSGIQFSLNQGINLYRFPKDIDLNAYVEYNYRSRDKNQKYYDANGPAVGIEVRYSSFRAGIDYFWESLPPLNESSYRFQIYLSWFVTWDLKNYFKSKPERREVVEITGTDIFIVEEKKPLINPKIEDELIAGDLDKPTISSSEKAAKTENATAISEEPANAGKSSISIEAGASFDDPEKDIRKAIEGWLTAWSSEDIDAYAGFYSSDFLSAKGLNKDEHIKDKRGAFAKPHSPHVAISNLAIAIKGDIIDVVFMQSSEPNSSQQIGWKRLVWSKYGDEWKILYERDSANKLLLTF